MANIYFTKDHEYVRIDAGVGTVGISDYAQKQLGDVVFVELPAQGATLAKGAAAAVVESVKAASDVFAPVSGAVAEVNAAAESQPGMINEDPLGRGWLYKIRLSDPKESEGLMDEKAYADFLESLA